MENKTKQFALYVLLAGIVVLSLASVGHVFWSHFSWKYEPLHSAIEGIGGMIAIFLAVVLLLQKQQERLFWVIPGLLGMGILDCFHSFTRSGEGFVLLHSAAVLVGGFWFAFVWLPAPGPFSMIQKWLPSGVVSVCIFFGAYVIPFRETLPVMVNGGEFTNAAIALNLIGGGLFLIAAIRFLVDFHRTGLLDWFLFFCTALFFGLSGILFKYSAPWNDTWWFWHILRLLTYFVVVGDTFLRFYRSEEEIKKLNEGLEGLVKERTEQLSFSNKELEAFAYSVSHDLRTPLRAIDGFSLIVSEDYANNLDDEGKRLIKVIRDNTIKMSRLIDDLLAFSRLGQKGVVCSDTDMEAVSKSVWEEIKSGLPARKIQMEIKSLPVAFVDPAMIRQVWVNLLANAVKFTGTKPMAIIEIGCKSENEKNIYFVKDNGAGFDMQYSQKLFGIFQRLHGQEEFEGTGVGLALVQRIIHKHGGRVWAESIVGEGATFYFSLMRQPKRINETSETG